MRCRSIGTETCVASTHFVDRADLFEQFDSLDWRSIDRFQQWRCVRKVGRLPFRIQGVIRDNHCTSRLLSSHRRNASRSVWREGARIGSRKSGEKLRSRNRGALSCRVMTAEMRDVLRGEKERAREKGGRGRDSMREREKGKEAITILYLPRWDKAFSVSCNGVESYPCYRWYGRSCSPVVSTCAVYTLYFYWNVNAPTFLSSRWQCLNNTKPVIIK